MAKKRQKKDRFAEIAAGEAPFRDPTLIEPGPPEPPDRELPSAESDPSAAFAPSPTMDTAEKLSRELARERYRMAEFMRDLAPKPESTRTRKPIAAFNWREETAADRESFLRVLDGKGEWQEVSIPHYDAPLGRAVTYYRTSFKVSKAMLAKGALFVCFKGVDYKAHVFVNGSYLGSHEGFFAPFEFDFTAAAREGENILVVQVENDAICMGNDSWGEDGGKYEGDKLYAATGPGYDEPEVGWHHCPPGMGIYQDVYVEARARIHVHDVFVRRREGTGAEAWIEVFNGNNLRENITLELSVFGQNFKKTIFRKRKYEVKYAGPTLNYYRVAFDVPDARLWQPDSPWLCQIQVKVLNAKGKTLDVSSRQFGLRSFRMDEESVPKGRFYLNDEEVRLRGANTMGHMQQCVMKKNWDQLRDDILLARICHMNFFRLTQRPIQPEIYEFCDRLGMMTQTDLPLFGVLRRNQFSEAVRQAGEMERLVRAHPCNIVVSYINEPFPNGQDKPHRYLVRSELEAFFTAADQAVRLSNPDRVIKPVDGDYDPPAPALPDNHCYCFWYNGHGIAIGKLNKGYWQKVKPGWLYGCGEFGTEGLDPVEVMRRYYPSEWLPQTAEEENLWTPDRIPQAQTGRFHYVWFETQHTLADWVRAGQAHQAWATKLMTEAFRRDSRMNSFAIHLFIDAFPSGWMKSIMDVERNPKPAYFAYRDALTPLMVHWRTDRFAYFSGEPLELEAWICNDLNSAPKNTWLHYQLEMDGKTILSSRVKADIPVCGSRCPGVLRLPAPTVGARSIVTARVGLLSAEAKVLHDSTISLDVFPREENPAQPRRAVIVGSRNGKACQLAREMGVTTSFSRKISGDDLILIDDMEKFNVRRASLEQAVEHGANAVFLEIPEGEFTIASGKVVVEACGMGPQHFVARDTGHPLVAGFMATDFRFWFDGSTGCVTPFLDTTFTANGFRAILKSGNGQWQGLWKPALAAAEKKYGKGIFRICQIALAGRVAHNPVAAIFAHRLLGN